MPTGYTAGIIDGKITTFPQFAKRCMRAFGACMHMRDDNMDKEYEPRIPSDYHIKELEKARAKVKQVESLSDVQIVKIVTKKLEGEKSKHLEQIAEINKAKTKLEEILNKALEFKPPTAEHEALKLFMVDQLRITLDHDADPSYYEKRLAQIQVELKSINATQARLSMMEDANKNIAYHLERHEEEVKRCADSNAWVESLLGALNCNCKFAMIMRNQKTQIPYCAECGKEIEE